MGIFDRLENAVEKSVNNAFSHVFRSGLKPVDVTSAIIEAMDDGVQEVAADRAIAPNHFSVHLCDADFAEMGERLQELREEFVREATEHAGTHDYVLVGPVELEFVADEEQLSGQVEVTGSTMRGAAAPATASAPSPEHPIIDVAGEKWLLTEPVTVIGRGREADIVVQDSGVSRRHLELRVTPTGVIATDLGSTNGTYVEGHRIDAATLVDGNQLTIGRTHVLFWTHAAPDDQRDR